jgi:hypothetical protein
MGALLGEILAHKLDGCITAAGGFREAGRNPLPCLGLC